jgi:nucleoside-diphosphate-sugar epimerase
MQKKIFITGANGMIGSALVRKLVDKYQLILLSPDVNRIEKFSDEVTIIQKKLSDLEEWKEHLEGVSCLIHLAAAVHWTPKTEEDKEYFKKVNAEETRKVFLAAKEKKVDKFLFFSTNDVYRPSEQIISEKTEVNPSNIYGESKLQAEKYLLNESKESDTEVVIFRAASVYGKNDGGSMKTLVNLCNKGIIPMLGKGKNKKALLYLEDLVQAVEKYIESNDDLNNEIFNIHSGNYEYKEIIYSICEVFDFKVFKFPIPEWFINNIAAKISFLNKLETAAENKVTSSKKAEELLGYKSEFDLVQGLGDSKDYYKKEIN